MAPIRTVSDPPARSILCSLIETLDIPEDNKEQQFLAQQLEKKGKQSENSYRLLTRLACQGHRITTQPQSCMDVRGHDCASCLVRAVHPTIDPSAEIQQELLLRASLRLLDQSRGLSGPSGVVYSQVNTADTPL